MFFVRCSALAWLCLLWIGSGAVADPGAKVALEVSTDAARYAPGSVVTIRVELSDLTGRGGVALTVSVSCRHLEQRIATLPPRKVSLAGKGRTTVSFRWSPPPTDYRGYALLVTVRDGQGRVVAERSSAVDVSSDWAKFPRYGYLSSFSERSPASIEKTIRELNRYHLNVLQFYDWQYKHHRPLAGTVEKPLASWKDIANRATSRRTVLDFISSAHRAGMAAMNYNLLYGAWSGYGEEGVDYRWGLWSSAGDDRVQDQLPMPGGWATPTIYLFHPGDPGWQDYLIGREAEVFAAYPFDGWHVDQVGDRGKKFTFDGKEVDVWKTFRPFLTEARKRLKKRLVFNNVGGYGLFDTAANAPVDAVYVECWPFSGQSTYNDLQTMVNNCRDWGRGKGVILAAYMNYGLAKKRSDGSPGRFNLSSVLLTNAAIFASGGSHLELGDDGALLASEYFPNRSLVSSEGLTSALRSYYDFLVAYENLLRDGVTEGRGRIAMSVPGGPVAAPDAVWAFARTRGNRSVLHFINLRGRGSIDWRDDDANAPPPIPQRDVEVRYYYGGGGVRSVHLATPDGRTCLPVSLPFRRERDETGEFVRFTLPELKYWDMVFLEVSGGR